MAPREKHVGFPHRTDSTVNRFGLLFVRHWEIENFAETTIVHLSISEATVCIFAYFNRKRKSQVERCQLHAG